MTIAMLSTQVALIDKCIDFITIVLYSYVYFLIFLLYQYFICYFISGFVINDTLKYTYKQQQYKTCLNIINFLNYDKAVS